MACPGIGPCEDWDLTLCCLDADESLPDRCVVGGQTIDPVVVTLAKRAASQVLWMKTGMQYGECEVTIRPCRRPDCNDDQLAALLPTNLGGIGFQPALIGGEWFNVACGCAGACCCKACEVDIPYPTCSVSEVKIDGVVIPADSYRIDDYRKLVRTDVDISGCWPTCQDMNLPDTEVGTWSITLKYGRVVPDLVLLAAAEFACELLKACSGQACKLPSRVISVARQGINMNFIDKMSMLSDGLTGLFLCDLAIQTYNPGKLTRRPAIWSPDAEAWRTTTG